MSTRRRLARFNRALANPLIGRVVERTPGFGAVIHRGRRSGRECRTPVMVFRRGGRCVLALPYGSESDWVRNTLAAGGCDLVTRGRRARRCPGSRPCRPEAARRDRVHVAAARENTP